MIEATQADIDAAKLYIQGSGPWKLDEIGIGKDDLLVQVFARHRIAQSDALKAENERLREHLISALDTLKDAEVCDDNCSLCNEAYAALKENPPPEGDGGQQRIAGGETT